MLIYAENATSTPTESQPKKPAKKKVNWKSMSAEEYKAYLGGLGGAIR